MLREALGGNCVTRLLVTTSACPNSAHETLNCLTFAKRAMSLKNFPAPYVSVEKIKEKQIDVSITIQNIELPEFYLKSKAKNMPGSGTQGFSAFI